MDYIAVINQIKKEIAEQRELVCDDAKDEAVNAQAIVELEHALYHLNNSYQKAKTIMGAAQSKR